MIYVSIYLYIKRRKLTFILKVTFSNIWHVIRSSFVYPWSIFHSIRCSSPFSILTHASLLLTFLPLFAHFVLSMVCNVFRQFYLAILSHLVSFSTKFIYVVLKSKCAIYQKKKKQIHGNINPSKEIFKNGFSKSIQWW